MHTYRVWCMGMYLGLLLTVVENSVWPEIHIVHCISNELETRQDLFPPQWN